MTSQLNIKQKCSASLEFDFPVYSSCWMSDSLLIVGGGGGEAKSGRKNVLALLQASSKGLEELCRLIMDDEPILSLIPTHDSSFTAVGLTKLYSITIHASKDQLVLIRTAEASLNASIMSSSGSTAFTILGMKDGTVRMVPNQIHEQDGMKTVVAGQQAQELPRRLGDHPVLSVSASSNQDGHLIVAAVNKANRIVFQKPPLHPTLNPVDYSFGARRQQASVLGQRDRDQADGSLRGLCFFGSDQGKECVGLVAEKASCHVVRTNLEGFELARSKRLLKEGATLIAPCIEGGFVGVGGNEGGVALVDPKTMTRLCHFKHPLLGYLTGLSFSPSGLRGCVQSPGGVSIHDISYRYGYNTSQIFMLILVAVMVVSLLMAYQMGLRK